MNKGILMTVKTVEELLSYLVLGVAIIAGFTGYAGLSIAGVAIYLASKI